MRFVISSLADSSHAQKSSDYSKINQDFLLACRERVGSRAVVDTTVDDNLPFYDISCLVASEDLNEVYQIVIDELRSSGYDTENCSVVFLTD